MELSITEIQAYENDLLRELSRVCKENNLTYYMAYGSLLGTIRHGGSIPWDPDADIFVPEKEYKHFLEELEKHMSEDFWIDYRTEGKPNRCFARFGKRGFDTTTLHVDIFRLASLPDNERKRLFYRRLAGFCIHARAVKVWPIEHFSEGKKKKVKILKVLLFPFSNNFFAKIYDLICRKFVNEKTKYVGRIASRIAYKREWFEKTRMAKYEDFEVMIPYDYEEVLTHTFGNYMEYPPEEERNKALNATYNVMEL